MIDVYLHFSLLIIVFLSSLLYVLILMSSIICFMKSNQGFHLFGVFFYYCGYPRAVPY